MVLNEAIRQGESIADLLIRLASKYAWFGDMVFDGPCSQVSEHISAFVNDSRLELPQRLSTGLNNGDTLTLIHALEGGDIE